MEADFKFQNLIPGLPNDIGLDCLIRVPYRHHSKIKSVCRRWNALLSEQSFYRQRAADGKGESMLCLSQAVVIADHRLPGEKPNAGAAPISYRLTVYNAGEDTWCRLPETPLLPAGIPIFSQCAAVGGKLIVLGGWDPNTLVSVGHVYVYDFVKGGGWARGASMSTARSFFASAVVGSLVYVAGGHDNHKNALKSAEVYDPMTDSWQSLPDMAQERDECLGFSTGDDRLFWVVSGYRTDMQGRFDSSAEAFDRFTGSWNRFDDVWTAPRSIPRALCCLPHRRKRSDDSGTRLSFPAVWSVSPAGDGCCPGELREYDAADNGWKLVGPVPDCMRSSPCVALANGCRCTDGQIFMMASGLSDGGDATCVLLTIEIASKKWTRLTVPDGFCGYVHAACALTL